VCGRACDVSCMHACMLLLCTAASERCGPRQGVKIACTGVHLSFSRARVCVRACVRAVADAQRAVGRWRAGGGDLPAASGHQWEAALMCAMERPLPAAER